MAVSGNKDKIRDNQIPPSWVMDPFDNQMGHGQIASSWVTDHFENRMSDDKRAYLKN